MKKLLLVLLIPLIFCFFPCPVYCSDEYVPTSDDVAKFLFATAYSTGCEYSVENSDLEYLSNYLYSAYQNSDLDLISQISSFVSGGSVFLNPEQVNNIWSFFLNNETQNTYTGDNGLYYVNGLPVYCGSSFTNSMIGTYGVNFGLLVGSDYDSNNGIYTFNNFPVGTEFAYSSLIPNFIIKKTDPYGYCQWGFKGSTLTDVKPGLYRTNLTQFKTCFLRMYIDDDIFCCKIYISDQKNGTGNKYLFTSLNDVSLSELNVAYNFFLNHSTSPFSANSFSGGGTRGGGAGRNSGITITPQSPVSDIPVSDFIYSPEVIIQYVETTNELFHLTIAQPPYNVTYDSVPADSDLNFDGIKLFYGSNLTPDVEVFIEDCTIDYTGLNQSYVDIAYNNAVARLYLNISGTESSENNIFYLIWQAIKGIFDFLKSLFTFDSSIITDFKTANMPKILWIQDITTYFNEFGSSLMSGDAPIIYANLGDSESYNIGGNIEFINMSWYTRYKPIGDVIIGGFLWILFIWNVYKHLPSIINGVSSSVDSFKGGE